MASQDPVLDEIQWSAPHIAQNMQGIHSNSVLFYFADSPFFDRTSNNAVLFSQAIFNPQMLYLVATREAFEGRLKTMAGLEYLVAQEPADPVNGTGVWVINKQTRRKRHGEEDEITVHSSYFVVGLNIYMAPSLADVLGSRTLSILTSLNKFFTLAAALPSFTPALGNTYVPPPSTRLNQNSTQSQLGQASKENTPLPDSLQNPKKAALPSTNNSTYLSSRLLEETLNITLKYGDEYMDENPITGEPGAFHLSTTGRKEKDKDKLMVPTAAKPGTGPSSKAPTPAPPSLKTDLEPPKKGKGEKTPTKSPASAKPKRKKSKVLSAGEPSRYRTYHRNQEMSPKRASDKADSLCKRIVKFSIRNSITKTPSRKRARYDLTRRQEVKSCSDGDLCTTYIPHPSMSDRMREKTESLSAENITLDFASNVIWDLRALTEDIVSWLNTAMKPDKTSKVGILSSPQFLKLVESSLEQNPRMNFQRMIYAISLAYTQPAAPDKHAYGALDLYRVGSIAGHEFLKDLDRRLRPEALKRCDENVLQALFLLLVGTILAVGYTEFRGELPDCAIASTNSDQESVPDNESQPPRLKLREYIAMRSHLCQILAHYVVFLASQLNLRLDSHVEQFMLETAANRWHKKGAFWWNSSRADHDCRDENLISENDIPTNWIPFSGCKACGFCDTSSNNSESLDGTFHLRSQAIDSYFSCGASPGQESPDSSYFLQGFPTTGFLAEQELIVSNDSLNLPPEWTQQIHQAQLYPCSSIPTILIKVASELDIETDHDMSKNLLRALPGMRCFYIPVLHEKAENLSQRPFTNHPAQEPPSPIPVPSQPPPSLLPPNLCQQDLPMPNAKTLLENLKQSQQAHLFKERVYCDSCGVSMSGEGNGYKGYWRDVCQSCLNGIDVYRHRGGVFAGTRSEGEDIGGDRDEGFRWEERGLV
ncbi:hypothetical protein G7Y89_g2527 [Cudoniella acicularis]|uniref:Mediator of RNA polymerase II transcription subunit 6 n=1 Tax=Cudoniella acicularis TaxID=354080 RepID=A0A8H4RV74_9HELO|nr:hypothetical protein G7Y89_g2527 [Cudoniella acicularis]